MVASLPGDAQRSLPVVVGKVWAGPGPQQQPHGLGLVLDDAVVEGGVALLGPPVEGAAVLDQEVNDVERAAGLLGDGVMKTSFSKLLKFEEKC